ncbi:predicted protein [Sclerotinia sclerotiorum 1980 UF-70]|uniref:Uncharacterized protein n=2 Tax=Sclerotinia sclerotiorum (strain ATCC 18683 / 1980 / Ss-1) TaxID=665079 RepID=A7EZX5_SCLS1|nr:predicted protein [Sclerotinia sclerotiorum 1980 UF-70]APA12139.1 hypothetical protein sscle_09g069090 [Sclerotinia sclerotiorum 1980 UF-70]EDN95017.1 predicted protein [Sclerotinia sclerotiorum 1980 UF-70]
MLSLKTLITYLTTISISISIPTTASAAPQPALPNQNLVTPNTLITDINTISQHIQSLTHTLTTQHNKLLTAAPLSLKFAAIHASTTKAYIDAQVAKTANPTDSSRIVEFTYSNVGVEVPEAIRVLKSKKEDFSHVGLSSIVLVGLKLLRHDYERFSEALLAKLAPDVRDRADEMIAVIDKAFQDGIDYFSS